MASALKSADKPFEYVEIDGGNHDLWRVAERTQLLEAVEKFLARNLAAPIAQGEPAAQAPVANAAQAISP